MLVHYTSSRKMPAGHTLYCSVFLDKDITICVPDTLIEFGTSNKQKLTHVQ